MMVRNEEKRLEVTLKSIVGCCSSLIIYDTGSEDRTIEILRDFSRKHSLPLHLIEGKFVDFSTSRNVLLDYADQFPEVEYLLLLDCNDELRGGETLLTEATKYQTSAVDAFLTTQEWLASDGITRYYNIRFLKPRRGWRYQGVVHEYLTRPENGDCQTRLDERVTLYQDRTQDDDKTSKRFARDRILLELEHTRHPEDPRTVFYLAQTYACLNERRRALEMYRLRTTMIGFWEERYQAFFKAGELVEQLGEEWSLALSFYMEAWSRCHRAEPMIKLAEHYRAKEEWLTAFLFARMACEVDYPHECILFVDRKLYDYYRWHLLGIIGWYAQRYEEGKAGCLKAIETGGKAEIDVNNLQFYLKRETKKPQTKKEFLTQAVARLRQEQPRVSVKNLYQLAEREWARTKES